MQIPNFADGQYVNAALLNSSTGLISQSISEIGAVLHTPGLIGASAAQYSATGFTLTANLPLPFHVLFASGTVAAAHGTTNGTDSSTYVLNVASLVPATGSVTVFLLASQSTVGLLPVQVVGPPVGHPDYDPSFPPFTLFSELASTLVLSAGLTPPDNATTFELCRFTLTAGFPTPGTIDTSHTVRAGALLSQSGEVVSADLAATGVAPGTYTSPDLTIGADGRITLAVADSLLGKSNLWTGVNEFTNNIILGNSIGLYGRATTGTPQLLIDADNSNIVNAYVGLGGFFRIVSSNAATQLVTVDNSGNVNAAGQINTPNFVGATGLQLNNTGSSAVIFTDPSTGTFGANDVAFRTGASGHFATTVIDSSGSLHLPNGIFAGGNANVAGFVTAAAGVSGSEVVNIAQFSSSLGGSGYKRIPDPNSPVGYFLMQWGETAAQAPSGVTFPITFPFACLQLVVSEANANAGGWGIGHPTVHGSENPNQAGYVAWSETWNGTIWTGASNAQSYIAVGF